MAKSHLALVSPTTLKRTVRPRRRSNADLRTREYLTEAEIGRLMNVAKKNRWGIETAQWSWWPIGTVYVRLN